MVKVDKKNNDWQVDKGWTEINENNRVSENSLHNSPVNAMSDTSEFTSSGVQAIWHDDRTW